MNTRSFLILLFITLYSFIGEAQTPDSTKNYDTTFFKITLVPLEVEQPKITTETIKADSLDFHVILISDSITVKFSSIYFKTISVDKLDKFIKDYNISKVSPRIYLEATKELSIERIEEIIDVFKNNNIVRFNIRSR